MIVIDASAATKLLLPDEPARDEVDHLWHADLPIHAPATILPEVAAALSAASRADRIEGGPTELIDAWLSLSNELVRWTVDDDLATTVAMIAATGNVRGMDAVYLAVARELIGRGLQALLLSFDGRQRKAALDLGIAVIPAEVPDA